MGAGLLRIKLPQQVPSMRGTGCTGLEGQPPGVRGGSPAAISGLSMPQGQGQGQKRDPQMALL